MQFKTLGIILSSGFFVALITAIFTKLSKDKTDKLQYITNERKQWRDDIRKATLEVKKINDENQTDKMFNTFQEAKTYFQVRLNPEDTEDNKLLDCFDIMNNEITDNFDEYVARLLKHDWERVKKETNHNFLKPYSIVILAFFLIYQLYPITKWFGLNEQQTNIGTLNVKLVLNELLHLRTLLLLSLFPMLLSIINGVWIILLKILNFSSKHESKKAAICSWLKIPYRGIILNTKKNNIKQETQNGKDN